MKTFKFYIIVITFLFISCSKGDNSSGSTPKPIPTPIETAVAFSVTQDPGTGNILGVVGTSQAVNIKISSALPAAGINIEVVVKKDADNTSIFANSSSSVAADNIVNITGLTPGVLCTAIVVVTSKSTATNSKTISFKLAAK